MRIAFLILSLIVLSGTAFMLPAYDGARQASSFIQVAASQTSDGAWAVASNGRIYWCTPRPGAAPACGEGALPAD